MTESKLYRIAIVGAGPVGCTLARLLTHLDHNQRIQVTIFEAEESLDFRSQGGTLDLHEKTGQLALRRAGLFAKWEEYARYDGEAMKLADKKLLCYISTNGGRKDAPKTGRPEIDRPQLRQLLYDSLPEDIVRWQHKLVRVDRETRTLHFANGESATGFDLIVGADGAWSRIRPVLTDVKPEYSGIAGHEFHIPAERQSKHPELFELVNRGSVFAWSDKKGLFAQAMSDGSINTSLYSVRPSDWQSSCGYDIGDASAVKSACREDLADWDSRLIAFTQSAATDRVTSRDLYMLPVGHRWGHVPGFTLIGDAAHLMTPFAGEGVNLGMKDSLKLAEAILAAVQEYDERKELSVDTSSILDRHVHLFEEDMFVRANETQTQTVEMMTAMFMRPGAPRTGIEDYILAALGDEAAWVTTLARPLVYAYFFVFKLIW